MNRRHLAILILVLWGAGLAWLFVRRQPANAARQLGTAVLNVNPGAAYHRLALRDVQIGWTSSTIDTMPAELRIEEVWLIHVPVDGRSARISVRTQSVLSRALRLKSFETHVTGDLERFIARGELEGDSVLHVSLITSEDSSGARISFTSPPTLPSLVPLTLAFRGSMNAGDTASYAVFDPILLRADRVHVAVGGDTTMIVPDSAAFDSASNTWVPVQWDTTTATRVDLRRTGLVQTAWIGADGSVVHGISSAGVISERLAFELAYENYTRRGDGETRPEPTDLGVSLEAPIRARNAAAHDSLTIVLHGLDLARFTDLDDRRQRRTGDTIVIGQQDDSATVARYQLPAPPDLEPGDRSSELLIPALDARIEAQARQILGRERHPGDAMRLLVAWVASDIALTAAPGPQTAVNVLEVKAGDANGKVVLLVALARSAGMPARPVTGVIEAGNRFYYHTWAEVYLGDWVAVDPVFGVDAVDAGYLRLAIGRLARPSDVINLIGGLKLGIL